MPSWSLSGARGLDTLGGASFGARVSLADLLGGPGWEGLGEVARGIEVKWGCSMGGRMDRTNVLSRRGRERIFSL